LKQGVSSRFSATYNGDGLRASKTDLFSATYHFTWGPGGVLYDGATTYTPGLAQRYGTTEPRYYHSDWVGSTRYLSESTGLLMPSALRYDAYGQRTALAGPNYPTPYQFAGGWGYETEYSDSSEPYLGLAYVDQRYYEPATGRFISPDPIGLAGGLNLFAYCDNDPVNSVDPSGLNPVVLPALAEAGATVETGIAAVGVALQQAGAAIARTGAVAVAGVKTALQGIGTNLGLSGVGASCSALSGGGADLQPTGTPSNNGGGADLQPTGTSSNNGGGADLQPTATSSDSGGGIDLLPEAARHHGNDLQNTRATHVYRIDGPGGGLHKIGESSQGTRRDGSSVRAESQVRKLLRRTGQIYGSRIIKRFPNKAAARAYETRLIRRYTSRFGRPPGNPLDR
jgi:RHS repeat-associated protein